ncbi:keratin, type I cytoskeletal 18-like [Nycticebus coucang]|uniref:keratin, type I cytoskeletal 18-like n=1 Tax=Nycticebus coucang TaxID=9470 RepID=UPI00234D9354|nr:keratin, type I cytoskeletal 18-like [Nycticebus coucang]
MSFTTRPTTFSCNYWSLGSVQAPRYSVRPTSSAASIYAGTGDSGSRIFESCSTSFQGSWGTRGLATGIAEGLAGGIQTKKETTKELNNCLASYLDRVRNLETDNQRLESKILEYLANKGPQVRDWGHYFETIKDLRAQIFANSVDNTCMVLQTDNAQLAMIQSVESDSHGLRKVTDDTNVTQMQLETEIKALKEELLFMKNHEEEVKGLQAQTASSGLTLEADATKSQDLSKIIADLQAQYDKLARKNQEKLDKSWSQQIEESTSVVTSQFAEVGATKTMLTELTHTVQSLKIKLDSMRNQTFRLEDSLREAEACYAMEMENPNEVLLHLESELAQAWAEGQYQAQEYEALLNIKVKLEAEIATYRRLLKDDEDFNLGDALDSSNSMQTIQKSATCRIVDSKVVSETNNTKVLRH